ncbi:hypothetical protein SAMN04488134_101622 [Amphibacillus marinus]|uniref:Uncharacterized protein n=1 Tax=Amphibacillus marinus TaxID=872970 RepID=A0A1H8IHK5_9BACI|nr:hypothetical protein [Amphibacillus marinus]SEN68004.1 hypothetical protein SAMN04488134_101622 [Amphibacillus marinus]
MVEEIAQFKRDHNGKFRRIWPEDQEGSSHLPKYQSLISIDADSFQILFKKIKENELLASFLKFGYQKLQSLLLEAFLDKGLNKVTEEKDDFLTKIVGQLKDNPKILDESFDMFKSLIENDQITDLFKQFSQEKD